MKIEKVNENQIRCTLTREDLDNRQLKLSELAYGTEKAKSLFRDMMQQASYQFGFEAEDIPLMIEAIPLSSEAIILIITKVEYPEELDTRFSKFSEPDADSDLFADDFGPIDNMASEGADDILDLFNKIKADNQIPADAAQKQPNFIPLEETVGKKPKKTAPVKVQPVINLTKMYSFDDFHTLKQFAGIVYGFYQEANTLYKSPASGNYYLVINKGTQTPEDFNRLCNMLSEYAAPCNFTASTEAYLQEHYKPLIRNNALQVLGDLSAK